MSILVYRDFGENFIMGASYLEVNSPSVFPVLPTVSFLISMTSLPAAVLVGLSLVVGWILVCVAYIVTISRMIFAAAFDRLLPLTFAKVSERFHSPTYAVILAGVLAWIFVSIYILTPSFFSTWLQLGLIAPVGYLMPLLATFIFCFRKRELFNSTVGQFTTRVKLAVMSGIGVSAFLFYLVALSYPLSGPLGTVFLGSQLLLSYLILGVIIIIGLVIYSVARSRNKKLGIDISKIYSEIPPE